MFLELRNFFLFLYRTFLNLVYNQKCLICSCSKDNVLLCKNCAKDINYLSGFAHKIYKGIPIYSAFIYEKNIKQLIRLLKFSHKKQAAKVLARLLFEYFKKLDLNKDFIIIYPPSFFLKSASRGYSHMYLIAAEFSKLTGFKVEKKLIKKIKNTKPQYQAKNRKYNIKGSFEINKNIKDNYKDKNILLIDDIITSGATIEELVDCLFKNNIINITCLTISKVN